MKAVILALAATVVLAGCGVDGPPVPPQAAAAPGVTVSGDASIGVRTDDL